MGISPEEDARHSSQGVLSQLVVALSQLAERNGLGHYFPSNPLIRRKVIVRTRGHKMPADRTRSISTSRDAAEAAFKAATTKPTELPPKRPTVPNTKELVSLRIDREILDRFQEAGPASRLTFAAPLETGSRARCEAQRTKGVDEPPFSPARRRRRSGPHADPVRTPTWD